MIIKKIQKARELIKNNKLEKKGLNKFSNYKYYTPEQVNELVHSACSEVGLFNKYDLLRTERGLVAKLTVYDLENEDKFESEIATDIPEIKATNIAQQLGGAVTYSNRYLLMQMYDIVDNTLDFDSQDNRKKDEIDPKIELEAKVKGLELKAKTILPEDLEMQCKTGLKAVAKYPDLVKRIEALLSSINE
jgi:hypothetical protein